MYRHSDIETDTLPMGGGGGGQTMDQGPVCHCTVIWGPVYSHDPLLLLQLLACASCSLQLISSLHSASLLLHLSPRLSFLSLHPHLPPSSLSLFFVRDKAQVKSGPLSPQRKQMTVFCFFQPHFCRPPPEERSVSLGGEGEMRRID